MNGAVTAGIFQVLVALIALSSVAYGIRNGRRGKEREDAQASLMAAEARQLQDREQRFEELKTSLAAARADLKYYAEQLKIARDEAKASVDRAAKIIELERRLSDIESDKDDAYEQSDLLGKQLDQEREANNLLRLQVKALLAELDAAKEQNAILVEHAKRIDDWWHLLIRQNGHPVGVNPPPSLTRLILPPEDDLTV